MRAQIVGLVVTLAVASWSGCGTKKNLDSKVDTLVSALQEGSYERLEAASSEGLLADMSRERFELISEAVASLGDMKDRTMKGIEVRSGAADEGRYTLEFERGEVSLVVHVDDERLVGFELTGSVMDAALRTARNARYAAYEVRNFQLVDASGKPNPRGNVYAVGDRVQFELVLQGVTAVNGKYHVKGVLVLKGADGAEVARVPDFLDTTVAADPNKPRVVTINGGFAPSAPDSLQIELVLRARDKITPPLSAVVAPGQRGARREHTGGTRPSKQRSWTGCHGGRERGVILSRALTRFERKIRCFDSARSS